MIRKGQPRSFSFVLIILLCSTSLLYADRPGIDKEQYKHWIRLADQAHQERMKKEKVLEAIEQYKKAILADPTEMYPYSRIAELYYTLAYAYGEGLSEDELLELYGKGKEYGYAGIRVSPRYIFGSESGMNDQDIFERLTLEDISVAFWLASCWGRWAELKGIIQSIKDIPKVKNLMERIMILDESYYAGGVHRFFGCYYLEVPFFMGKSKDKAKKHFQRAIAIDPNYLENYILYAEYYVKKYGEKGEYMGLLKKVLSHKVPEDYYYDVENRTARRKAKKLLESMK